MKKLLLLCLLCILTACGGGGGGSGGSGSGGSGSGGSEGGDDAIPFCYRALESGEKPISSAADLANISADLTASYLVTNDISLSSYANWTPIADFEGTLDGNCYVISDLTINSSNTNLGLFESLDGAEITKLKLEDVNISGTAGYAVIGAIAANTDNSSINHSSAKGIITSTNAAGGLVGSMKNGSLMANSYSLVDVTAKNTAGGIVANIDSSGIERSYSAGNVTNSDYTNPSAAMAGGIAGYMSYAVIRNSYSTGTIKSEGILAGGIAGLAGQYCAIQYSYSAATVDAIWGGSSKAGGILGTFIQAVDPLASISYSVAINPLIIGGSGGSGGVGPIVPERTDAFSNPDSIGNLNLEKSVDYDIVESDKMELSGQTPSNFVVGTSKTMAELKTQSTYEAIGWKFGNNADNPWQMRGGYPVLYWQ